MIKPVLALTAVLLAGVLAYQWSGWPPPPSAGVDGAMGPDGGNGLDATEDPLARLAPPEDREAYASVTERPLFRPQRKPAEAEPEAPEPAQGAQPAVDLAGLDLSAVVITPAVVSAWVRDNKGQELKRVRLGDELEGWAVKDILRDRLVLERQGERNELVLRDFTQTPPPRCTATASPPDPRDSAHAPEADPKAPAATQDDSTSGPRPGGRPPRTGRTDTQWIQSLTLLDRQPDHALARTEDSPSSAHWPWPWDSWPASAAIGTPPSRSTATGATSWIPIASPNGRGRAPRASAAPKASPSETTRCRRRSIRCSGAPEPSCGG